MARAGTKVGLSDPVVPYGRAIAQQIKGTPGITGLSPLSVHSGEEVWHLNTLGCCKQKCCTKNSAYIGEPVSDDLCEIIRPVARQYRGKSSVNIPSAYSVKRVGIRIDVTVAE